METFESNLDLSEPIKVVVTYGVFGLQRNMDALQVRRRIHGNLNPGVQAR
jgi:hypothetical protein